MLLKISRERVIELKEELKEARQFPKATASSSTLVRGRSTSSDVSSDISPSPLYIPPHRRQPKTECTRGSDTGVR